MLELVDFDGALLFAGNQRFDVTVIDFLFAIAELFEALKYGLKLFFAFGFIAHRHQLGAEGVTSRMLTEYQHIAIEPNGLGTHDFVGQTVFHHSVLVDARLVGKGITTHDGFVGGHRDADERAEQTARAGQLGSIDFGVGLIKRLTGVERHHYFFE